MCERLIFSLSCSANLVRVFGYFQLVSLIFEGIWVLFSWLVYVDWFPGCTGSFWHFSSGHVGFRRSFSDTSQLVRLVVKALRYLLVDVISFSFGGWFKLHFSLLLLFFKKRPHTKLTCD